MLIAQRPPGKHLAGRWEFPGGKMADGETEAGALARELREELGIELQRSESLMTLAHAYPDRDVELHLHLVPEFAGDPQGLDGQQIKWVPLELLCDEDLLEADRPFIEVLQRHRPRAGQ